LAEAPRATGASELVRILILNTEPYSDGRALLLFGFLLLL
jgi:hypothetical protein